MKCINTLSKAFLSMGIVFAYSMTLGEIGVEKFQLLAEASNGFDHGENVAAIKACLLREVVKGEGLDLILTGNLKEELGGPATWDEDGITILQKK